MDHLANMPVTILVKAPNQKIGDQTVECFMDWTVKRLKSHLAAVYPSKPAEKSQRIIYSGKLLQDHSVLQDVLRSIDSETLHTVHLVCTPTPEEMSETGKSSSSSPNQLSTPLRGDESNSQGTNVGDSSTDGIRQRSHQPRETSNVTAGYSAPYYQNSASVAAAYQNMNPQQLQWMQQLYMQQMAYYMQYSSQPGMNQGFIPPVAYQFPQQPIDQRPPPIPVNQAAVPPVVNNNPAAAVPEPARNAPRVPNQQMNAGVGPAMNDDVEEEAANRDWLDWIYTLCRFGVLLSIVYFYSSMNRFLLVTGIMFLVYLYEHNFFRLRRANVARVQIEERIGEVENNEEANNEVAAADQVEDETDGSSNLNNETPDADQLSPDSSNENSDGTEETSRSEPPPEEPSRPGFFGTLWIFVSTFFTSLIPQGPQHLNVN